MNQIEKAIEHLKENPHLIEEFAKQYDAVVPKRVVKFSEEVRVPHYVEYELEIPAHVGQDISDVRSYIRDNSQKVHDGLDEKVSNEEWAYTEWAVESNEIDMVMYTERGEKRTHDDLGMM